MKKIRNYFLTVIVLIMMFGLTGCSFEKTVSSEDFENNAKVTIVNDECLKIESPVDGKVKIEVIMLDDGVISHVKKEVDVKHNEERELKASEFESAKYKPTNNSKFKEIVEIETVTDIIPIVLAMFCAGMFGVVFLIVGIAYAWNLKK